MNRPLSVGRDVASHSLVDCIVDANGAKVDPSKTYRNTLPAGGQRVTDLIAEADKPSANALFCATEATGFYDWHLLESLAESTELAVYQPKRYRLSPRAVKAFTAIASQTDKTDRHDAFFSAN
ncbi:transposase [Candidatus Poribacteria bacterium]|nr:transposase [Candidatus Poribacteria bacterium]